MVSKAIWNFINYILFPLNKKYKPPIKRKVCILVKSCFVINQSLWAIAKMQTIKITIFKPANLDNVWPIGFLIKFAIISITPVDTSDIATKLARNGDRSKYSISPSGGKGNLPIP